MIKKILLPGYGGYGDSMKFWEKFVGKKGVEEFPECMFIDDEDISRIKDISRGDILDSLDDLKLGEIIRCENRIFICDEENKHSEGNYVTCLYVWEVDTSNRWTIDEYDGALSIKYLKEPKLINEEFNYYEE